MRNFKKCFMRLMLSLNVAYINIGWDDLAFIMFHFVIVSSQRLDRSLQLALDKVKHFKFLDYIASNCSVCRSCLCKFC